MSYSFVIKEDRENTILYTVNRDISRNIYKFVHYKRLLSVKRKNEQMNKWTCLLWVWMMYMLCFLNVHRKRVTVYETVESWTKSTCWSPRGCVTSNERRDRRDRDLDLAVNVDLGSAVRRLCHRTASGTAAALRSERLALTSARRTASTARVPFRGGRRRRDCFRKSALSKQEIQSVCVEARTVFKWMNRNERTLVAAGPKTNGSAPPDRTREHSLSER